MYIAPVTAIKTVLGLAESHLEDVTSGVAEGLYNASDNADHPQHLAAAESVKHWLTAVDRFELADDHPEYPFTDWQDEVANNDTRLGYEEWVDHKIQADSN
jgi:hypothetical protein